ncbi:MAG: HD domain-containing protein [Calditrichia bacterium]
MKVEKIILKYYDKKSKAYDVLMTHSELVRDKALWLAERVGEFKPDMKFISEAAMLHDIGIIRTDAPKIGCHGKHPYIAHGYLGRKMVEAFDYPKHALVCERHTGVGISIKDIKKQGLPIPLREMRPVSLEEQIICFADKFYSKNPKRLYLEKPLQRVRSSIAKHGDEKVAQLEKWIEFFHL